MSNEASHTSNTATWEQTQWLQQTDTNTKTVTGTKTKARKNIFGVKSTNTNTKTNTNVVDICSCLSPNEGNCTSNSKV